MSDSLETAQETMEHAHHAAEHGPPVGSARLIAVMVAILAAMLAMAEMGEKSAQNAYLTYHITATDDFAFYQAKNIRSNLYGAQADLLASLPNAADPAIAARIAAARATVRRLDDDPKGQGRKQLLAKAQESIHARDHQFHRYHLFEIVVGALQIAIVLASVSVVTRVNLLAVGAGLLGGGAGLFGLAVALGWA
ncbi:MAG: DUF4337 family protein [Rhodospirillales bacterium]|nr:DUF4337 family protein [Rhodospirillales bacterium]MDE2574854.1 DUF4337 family protein [Rhodospirillales bacterium]